MLILGHNHRKWQLLPGQHHHYYLAQCNSCCFGVLHLQKSVYHSPASASSPPSIFYLPRWDPWGQVLEKEKTELSCITNNRMQCQSLPMLACALISYCLPLYCMVPLRHADYNYLKVSSDCWILLDTTKAAFYPMTGSHSCMNISLLEKDDSEVCILYWIPEFPTMWLN